MDEAFEGHCGARWNLRGQSQAKLLSYQLGRTLGGVIIS